MHLKEDIERIRELLDNSQKVLITSHHNPDGDAVGSVLALYLTLKRDYNVKCAVPNRFPDFLQWMPGADELIVFEQYDQKDELMDSDLIFCLDYSALSRTGSMADKLLQSEARKVLVDHHPGPEEDQFDILISHTGVSSTAELIYDVIRGLKPEEKIPMDVATAIYVGIATDTGSFSFNCNHPKTFETTADLLRTGIDAEKIHRSVYDNFSESRLRLLGYCLSEKMTLVPELETAFISLSKEELERFDFKTGDTEGIVNYPLSIKNVKVSILLTGRKNKIRLSFRSKGNFKVNRIAKDHFEGGGHDNAAGGDSYLSMDETIIKLLNVMELYKEEIKQSHYG
jgi:phosphoesterase RecJ-like protein